MQDREVIKHIGININRNSINAEMAFLVVRIAMLLNPASLKNRMNIPMDPKHTPDMIGNKYANLFI